MSNALELAQAAVKLSTEGPTLAGQMAAIAARGVARGREEALQCADAMARSGVDIRAWLHARRGS